MSMIYADDPESNQLEEELAPGFTNDPILPFGLGNIFSDLATSIGLKNTYTQSRKAQDGASVPQVYFEYSNSLDYHLSRIPRIPKGSSQDALNKQAAPVRALRDSLAPMFAPGAQYGTKDEANVNTFVSGVKSLAANIEAAEKSFGITAAPDPTATGGGLMQMGSMGGIPWWGWALAAVGGVVLLKKMKKKGGRRKK